MDDQNQPIQPNQSPVQNNTPSPPPQPNQQNNDDHFHISKRKAIIFITLVVLTIALYGVFIIGTAIRNAGKTDIVSEIEQQEPQEGNIDNEGKVMVQSNPNEARRRGNEICGSLPDLSIPQENFDQQQGPFWLFNCNNVVWAQWTSGTSFLGDGSNTNSQQAENSSDGVYVYDVDLNSTVKIAEEGNIVSISRDVFEYEINDTVYSKNASEIQFNSNNETGNTTNSSESTVTYRSEIIDLYGIEVVLPTNWTITEVDRRPEPDSPGAKSLGHDCASYIVHDAQESASTSKGLNITPTCGFADGGPTQPSDSTVHVQSGSTKDFVRVGNGNAHTYGYLSSYEVSDTSGTYQQRSFIQFVSFASSKHEKLGGMLTIQNNSGEDTTEKDFEIFDTIAKSVVVVE